MRHGKKVAKLGRTSAHRKAMLSNMASSLIEHKRISTTVAKAKALRKYIEPLITKAKNDTTHSRRMVFRKVSSKFAVTELFDNVAKKVGDRPGGYTRILKTGLRHGDNADMCIIEFVDYNEIYTQQESSEGGKRKRRRTRRGGSGSDSGETTANTKTESKETQISEAETEEKPQKVDEVEETPDNSTEADANEKENEEDKV